MEIELVAVGTARAISLILSTHGGSKENDKPRNGLRNNESALVYVGRNYPGHTHFAATLDSNIFPDGNPLSGDNTHGARPR